ncbi:hypothetical protein [Neobacillus mesonae]|uniref:hypothetical protein n=1 Tax=Neobacillus mesonae TaxID=1193713 RepID=UPI002E1E5A30|nr:hypothetical protein [Neobacillus mesonae]
MTEFAIAVQSINEIINIEEPWNSLPQLNQVEQEMQQLFFEEWEKVFSKYKKPTRIYFGSEFCQYRLMPLLVVKRALDYCWTNGFEFTFATPYVHGAKYEQLVEILFFLNKTAEETGKTIEVVVNDWGIFHITQKKYPHLKIAVGRLLNKNIRDPRVANYYNDERAPEKGKQFFKQSGLLSQNFSKFLSKGNLASIEFDELIQGYVWPDEVENSYTTTFHYPFGTVASGSACMVGFMDSEKKDKFRGDPNCTQQCQKYVFELKNRIIPEMDTGIYQKGNTAFYTYKKEMIQKGLQQINEMKNSRVVYSLRIPV